MKIRKLLAAAIALVMVVAMVPVASLAVGVENVMSEAAAMSKLNNTWAVLDAAEAEAIASGMSRSEVIDAVYSAALNMENVDKDSFSDFTKDGFFFTVSGMYCSYNYRLRNELKTTGEFVTIEGPTVKDFSNGETPRHAGSANVLLVGPYYSSDSSFTDQYVNESNSIAAATGGVCTQLINQNATGPAIAAAYPDKGVVIYDSHGTASGTSSYLCLTTNSGITQTDYSNGWAVSSGSAAYIDGRYIENHVTEPLSNPCVWMAICEGMKRSGQGTTGYALLRAGAGVVYGYSQSVTFRGDYEYEAEFWNHMKDGEPFNEAYNAMVSRYGIPDPYGDAYPIAMCGVDPFPSNPDAAQVVNCDWLLYGDPEPVELVDFSLSTDAVEMYIGRSASVSFARVPENANQYELVWTSANEGIATVTGSNRSATITGVGVGTTTVTCEVIVNGDDFGYATVAVTVNEDTTLRDALNVEGGTLSFGTSEQYPFVAVTEGNRYLAKSGNAGYSSSSSTLTTTIQMAQGETLSFEYLNSSENNYDWYNFSVNGSQVQHLSGTNNSSWLTYTYTANAAGSYTFVWEFTKDYSVNSGNDCVKIDNVAYSGDPGETPIEVIPGDVDGDGIVTVSDALIALRIAMGIVDGTDEQIAAADLDGDGVVTASEALLIMRDAMGD
ncbi:MAG: dockerin type I repeat-containing protein [Clostridia bacterium]|nr:dockerin type I repeat-containing protein [Clostridia bacterium]